MITSASFIVTERCNLACTYCFENEWRSCGRKGDDMQPQTVVRGLDWLFHNAKESGTKQVSIMLFGGEPLLRPDICEAILQGGYERQQEHGISFKANLITNGSLMSREIEYLLYKYATLLPGFSCQLSLDGTKKAHDLYRVFPDGSGTFDVIERNINTYLNIFGGRLCVHGCVNKQTLPMLHESYLYYANRKIPNIWYMPVHTEDWTAQDVTEYDKQLGLIFDDMKSRKNLSIYAPLNKCLGGQAKAHDKTCGAGVSFMTITPFGGLFPCHNIYFNDAKHVQCCGSIFLDELNEDVLRPYREYNTKTLGCGDCENTACYRCIADNWAHNGDINKQVGKPIRCAMSSVERKYQTLAKEYADAHFVPQDLTEARVRKKMLADLSEVKDALSMLLVKTYNKELTLDADNGAVEPKICDGQNHSEGCV